MIEVWHDPEGAFCAECLQEATVALKLNSVEIYLCDVHWEELVNRLQGKGEG